MRYEILHPREAVVNEVPLSWEAVIERSDMLHAAAIEWMVWPDRAMRGEFQRSYPPSLVDPRYIYLRGFWRVLANSPGYHPAQLAAEAVEGVKPLAQRAGADATLSFLQVLQNTA